jgi:hypothetical protein
VELLGPSRRRLRFEEVGVVDRPRSDGFARDKFRQDDAEEADDQRQ